MNAIFFQLKTFSHKITFRVRTKKIVSITCFVMNFTDNALKQTRNLLKLTLTLDTNKLPSHWETDRSDKYVKKH